MLIMDVIMGNGRMGGLMVMVRLCLEMECIIRGGFIEGKCKVKMGLWCILMGVIGGDRGGRARWKALEFLLKIMG